MTYNYSAHFSPKELEWAKNSLENTKKVFPSINGNGIAFYGQIYDPVQDGLWNEDDIAMICICRHYLLQCDHIKTPTYSTYSLKHRIEEHFAQNGHKSYVHNGACIVACLSCGFTFKEYSRFSLKVGVSLESIRKLEIETEELTALAGISL